MSVIEITDREDLRVGDVATFAFDGNEFTGPLWTEGTGTLFIGPALVRYGGDSDYWSDCTFVRATREVPDLPTEPGSAVLVTECRGERADKPVVAWWDDVETYWITPTRRFGGMTTHDSPDITEWTPAKVVPA